MRIGGHFLCALTVFPVFLQAISPCSGQSLPTAKLGAETVQAFQGYVGIQEDLCQQRMNGRRPFLWIDDPPRNRSMVETGESEEFGWEAGIRTPIGRSRVCCPTVRRPPRRREPAGRSFDQRYPAVVTSPQIDVNVHDTRP